MDHSETEPGLLTEVTLLEDWTGCPAQGNHTRVLHSPAPGNNLVIAKALSRTAAPLRAERCPRV